MVCSSADVARNLLQDLLKYFKIKPWHLLSLLCALPQLFNHRILFPLLLGQLAEERVRVEVPGRTRLNADEGANRDEGLVRLINGHSYKLPTHPLEKVFNISDNVDPSAHSQDVSILGKQGGVDDPPP